MIYDPCGRTEGPISFTVTRVTAPSAAPFTDYQVYGNFTFCTTYSGCGNASESAIFLTVYPGSRAVGPLPERPCGRCNATTIGDPIDVATGEFYDERTDLKLSGPFGLSFTRFYSSLFPGTAALGGGNWTHNYAARLDVTSAPSGLVTYYDAQEMPYYFSGLHAGGSAYDGGTGMTLARSSDGNTYTLTTFGAAMSTFNASGELMSLRDRIGNTQTIARDTTSGHGDRIVSVTDSLNRSLCFYYDAASRITAVAAWLQTSSCPSTVPSSSVTTPVVTYAYDSPANGCPSTFLCSATEPDGGKWSYQYTDSTTRTNLTKVLDPLGNPVSINSYSGSKIVHHESGSCSGSSPCADTGGYLNITYPSSGSTVTVTDGLNRTSTLTYDPTSLLLTSIVGPVCNCGGDQTRTFAWDTYGRMTSQSDDGIDGSTKHTFAYTYGRDGAVAYPGPTAITENVAVGTTRTIARVYYPIGDPRQDLVQTTTLPSVDTTGTMTISNVYSSTGLLTQRTTTGYVNGAQTAYTRTWTYDARGRVLTANGPRTDVAQTTTYAYFADTDADAARAGQLHTVTDALGHVTTYGAASGFTSYSPFGGAQSSTDPNGVVTEITFDNAGRPVTKTVLPTTDGENSIVTQMSYDAAGRRTKVVFPKGNGVSYGYDTSSRPTQLVRFDAQLQQHERATVAYNAFDQPTSFSAQGCTAPATTCAAWTTGYSRTFAYSATTSDLTQIVNADNTAKTFTYTGQGAVATVNDENHATGTDYTQTYDLAGRVLTESRKLAGGLVTTSYAHDLHDNITSVTDPNGNVTTYHYDDFDRMTKETSPVSGVTTFAFDAAGNLTNTTNANGTVMAYTYDALDRALTENDVKGSASASETWTYDDPTSGHFGIGRMATMTDPSGSAGYTYDRLGNLLVVNKNVNGTTYSTGYFFDSNNDRSVVTYPDGTSVSFGFDFADRLSSASQVEPSDSLSIGRRTSSHAMTLAALRARSLAAPVHAARPETVTKATGTSVTVSRPRTITGPGRMAPQPTARAGGGVPTLVTPSAASRRTSSRADSTLVSSAAYAPFGPLTSLTFGNGTTQTLTYNQRYLPTENKLVAGATTMADHVYTEDAVGNVTGISDGLDAGYNRSYGYDDLNRLTTMNSGTKLWGTASGNGATYDAMGNPLTVTLGTVLTETFTQRAASGSAGLPLIATATLNGVSYSPIAYDAIGSLTSTANESSTYGARELVGNDPAVSSYMYDGFRQRVLSQLPAGTQRVSLNDTDQHLLAESALAASAPPIAYDYVWFGDRPVAQLDATSTHWTFADHVGTPLIQTDLNGAASWSAEYLPNGKIAALRASDVHQPLRFAGQVAEQFDTGANGASAFNYNNARWYRPNWERYWQADPLGIVSSPRLFGFRHARAASRMRIVRADADPTATDLYAYAEDNPLSFIDPTGLLPQWGNYCGPGWSNGMTVVDEANVWPSDIGPAGKGPAPVDALDSCCATHDQCHSTCSHGNPCKKVSCKNSCDLNLSSCSRSVGDIGSHGIWQGIGEMYYASALTDIFGVSPSLRSAGLWPW